ncbi:hypothetical protein FRC01_000196 [Tulasnella sp. 417]|nr:hypothetical protein FRC01_000196 [Tulasnella sp. 417]
MEFKGRNTIQEGRLLDSETPWAERYEFLKRSGYLLRPRYRPGWVAPWKLKPRLYSNDFEEGISSSRTALMDAQRLSDGKTIYLKHTKKDSPEVEIGQYLSSEELRNNPRNHCLPVLEVLRNEDDPEHVLLVMPWLRRIDSPEPASVRECVDFVQQTLEGLTFMHEHKVAHRDCAWGNIMMDGRRLYPQGWHPQQWGFYPNGKVMRGDEPSRTGVGGVRYYLIDFGISTKGQDETLGIHGQELSPELSDTVPYNPYKLDVYILGMTYQHFLIERHLGLDFLLPFIEYMTPKNPSERPSAAEALQRWNKIAQEMSFFTLSQRLYPRKAEPRSGLSQTLKDTSYRVRDLWWTATASKKPSRPLP